MKRLLFVCCVLALMTASPAVLQTRGVVQSGAPGPAAPTVIVGGGNGKMKLGGQHIVMQQRSPFANVHLTLLNKAGIEQDKFADSTGVISAL